MTPSIVILAGGGPAPGINTVISTVAKTFLKDGYRVIAIANGKLKRQDKYCEHDIKGLCR